MHIKRETDQVCYELGILIVFHHVTSFVMFDVVTIAGSSTEKIPCFIHTDVHCDSGRRHHASNHCFLQGEIRALEVDSSPWTRPNCSHICCKPLAAMDCFFVQLMSELFHAWATYNISILSNVRIEPYNTAHTTAASFSSTVVICRD